MPNCRDLLASTLLTFFVLPRSVTGTSAIMRAERGTGHGHPALSSEEAKAKRLRDLQKYLDSKHISKELANKINENVNKALGQHNKGGNHHDDSLLQKRKTKARSSTGGECLGTDKNWKSLDSTERPGVIFIDLGVEACQSTLMMLGESVENSCKYAADTRLAGGYEVCLTQNQQVRDILAIVSEEAHVKGFDIFKDQKVVMVEAGPQYSPVMTEVKTRYPSIVEFVPYAITSGRDDSNATELVYDTRQKTVLPAMVSRGNKAEDVKVKPLNLMRLLTYVARREDYVILKMDVEGAEFDIVPCLAHSPAADLVDMFLLERHDHFAGVAVKDRGDLTDAVQTLQRRGVTVRSDWP